MTSLQVSVDPKPLGAFLEYTLKPILDELRSVIELLEKYGIPAKDLIPVAIFLFIFERTISFLTAISVTSILCYTLLKII